MAAVYASQEGAPLPRDDDCPNRGDRSDRKCAKDNDAPGRNLAASEEKSQMPARRARTSPIVKAKRQVENAPQEIHDAILRRAVRDRSLVRQNPVAAMRRLIRN